MQLNLEKIAEPLTNKQVRRAERLISWEVFFAVFAELSRRTISFPRLLHP